MANQKVGGEVDAFCTRCKLTLAHTILAMVTTKIVRVRCNTCKGEHAYRNEPGARAIRKVARRTERPAAAVLSFAQRVAEKDESKAIPYSPKATFAVEDLVQHPTFGLGIVSSVRGDKVDIAFKAFQKTLIHGRPDGTVHKPHFDPPHRAEAVEVTETGTPPVGSDNAIENPGA